MYGQTLATPTEMRDQLIIIANSVVYDNEGAIRQAVETYLLECYRNEIFIYEKENEIPLRHIRVFICYDSENTKYIQLRYAERYDLLHEIRDHRVWAEEFAKIAKRKTVPFDPNNADDVDWLGAWFANAMMKGHDDAYRAVQKNTGYRIDQYIRRKFYTLEDFFRRLKIKRQSKLEPTQ